MTTETQAATCSGCSATLDAGASFCAACGRAAGAPPGAPVPPAAPPLQSSAFGSGFVEKHRVDRIAKGSKWLLVVSILFAVFGTIFGLMQRSEAEKAKVQLAALNPNQTYDIEGTLYTVAEMEKQLDKEVVVLFGLNYFLAVVMFGLFLWSKRAPLPAMVTGLCVYLAVIALNAALDPKTIVQGILIKIIFISAMIAGIKAALQQRDAAGRTS